MKKYKVYSVSDLGRCRQNNEDNFYTDSYYNADLTVHKFSHECIVDTSELVVAVFDGMGGADCGEQASLIAAKELADYTYDNAGLFNAEDAIIRMNRAVSECAKRLSNNMGSTVVMFVCVDDKAFVYNVGDSRAYLLRNGDLKQMSYDHTEENVCRQMYLDLGIEYNSALNGSKNILTQHLGIDSSEFIIEPYVSDCIETQDNDIFLLCSDGLTSMVDDPTIRSILEKDVLLKKKAELLIATANSAGGKDNITVTLLCVEEE